jgi:hypothetical protein
MLNCVKASRAPKTSGCAITYRAGGGGEMFGSCPASCMLKPEGESGTVEIDREYERAVRRAVPRNGTAWLYTHFHPRQWAERNQAGKTVFNFSAPSALAALAHFRQGIETVALVPHDFWEKLAHGPAPSTRNFKMDGVKYVRCPAEYLEHVNCGNCGGRDGPLCARLGRAFIVVFTAHGAAKRLAGQLKKAGGCYAAAGRAAIHWRNLSRRAPQTETDGEKIMRFARGLPWRTLLRHHVAGDLGAPSSRV